MTGSHTETLKGNKVAGFRDGSDITKNIKTFGSKKGFLPDLHCIDGLELRFMFSEPMPLPLASCFTSKWAKMTVSISDHPLWPLYICLD